MKQRIQVCEISMHRWQRLLRLTCRCSLRVRTLHRAPLHYVTLWFQLNQQTNTQVAKQINPKSSPTSDHKPTYKLPHQLHPHIQTNRYINLQTNIQVTLRSPTTLPVSKMGVDGRFKGYPKGIKVRRKNKRLIQSSHRNTRQYQVTECPQLHTIKTQTNPISKLRVDLKRQESP